MSVSSRLDAMSEPADREHNKLRVITVRMTPDLHARLKDAAWLKHASLNQLCVAALIEAVDEIYAEADAAAEQEPATC